MIVFEEYSSAYNEGFIYGAQVIASALIRSINSHPHWMLPSDRIQAISQLKLTTRHILERYNLVPTTYQVMHGNAEDVILDFNIK